LQKKFFSNIILSTMKDSLQLLLIILTVTIYSNRILAQQTPVEIIEKEYPCLYQMYADSIGTKTAHYIFALDVSSMMKTNVKNILPVAENFIRQIPNNDQISFVKKSATQESGAILRIAKINQNSRNDVIKFLYDNFSEDKIIGSGSDGYTMTQGIIDAILEPGSSDLVFVFMFSDFEYWTHSGGFNKNHRDWDSLHKRLKAAFKDKNPKQIHPYAFFYPDLTPEAIRRGGAQNDYRPELEHIFGFLHKYNGSTSLLQTILTQIRTRSSAYTMKMLIDAELKQLNLIEIKIEGNEIYAIIENEPLNSETSLVKGFTPKDISIPQSFEKYIIPNYSTSLHPNRVKIAEINRNYKPIIPVWKKLDTEISFSLIPEYLCNDELQMLFSYLDNVGYNPNMPIVFENVELPERTVFFHIFPFWLFCLLSFLTLFLLFCAISSIIIIIKPKYFSGTVSIYTTLGNERTLVSTTSVVRVKSVTVGNNQNRTDFAQKHIPIENASFLIGFKWHKKYPCCFFRKSGIFIYVLKGSASLARVFNLPGKQIGKRTAFFRGACVKSGNYQIVFS